MTEERVDTHQTGDAVEPGHKRRDDQLGRSRSLFKQDLDDRTDRNREQEQQEGHTLLQSRPLNRVIPGTVYAAFGHCATAAITMPACD